MSDSGTEAVWKALADPTRRAILDSLRVGPRTTGELCELFPSLGRTTVMKHLDVLESSSLITVEREGRKRFNHINPVPLVEIVDRWVDRHTQGLTRASLALKKHAETNKRKGT